MGYYKIQVTKYPAPSAVASAKADTQQMRPSYFYIKYIYM